MQDLVADAYAWVFGREKTPKELVRENRRMVEHAVRDVDRERQRMQEQERRVVAELRAMVKSGASGTEAGVRFMAQDLVRTRAAVVKFQRLRMHLQSVALRMQTVQGVQAMGQAMAGVTRALAAMNGQLNAPRLQRVLRDFERNTGRAEEAAEFMGDAIDESFACDEETEEADELVAQVLDEIGCSVNDQFATPVISAPRPQEAATGGTGRPPQTLVEEALEASLEERYAALRK